MNTRIHENDNGNLVKVFVAGSFHPTYGISQPVNIYYNILYDERARNLKFAF